MNSRNETRAITAMRDAEGNLPKYAWPGGYPLFYINEHCEALCASCASRNDEYDGKLIGVEENLENPYLVCMNQGQSDCEGRIESAYAEDEVEGQINA